MARKKKEENSEEEIKKPKAIGPFDILKMMFTDKAAFDALSNLILSRNFFMINRIMSIQFPLQAQCFNNMSINQAEVIRSWQQFATSKMGYGRVPGFVYTKGAKASQELKGEEVSKELKQKYCMYFQLSYKEFDDMMIFAHDKLIEHVNNFEKIHNTSEQGKGIQKLKTGGE